MKSIITFGEHQNINKLPKDKIFRCEDKARELHTSPIKVFKYEVFNHKYTHAVVVLQYFSNEIIKAINLALFKDINVIVLTPDDTIKFTPEDTVGFKANNILRRKLRDQAIRYSQQQTIQEQQSMDEDVRSKLNQLFSPKYLPTLTKKIKATNQTIRYQMLELGYEEDRLPEHIMPRINDEQSLKVFIYQYASIYDLDINNNQLDDGSTASIELFNRYGAGSGQWTLRNGSKVDKQDGAGYINLYAREGLYDAPDYKALYCILYFMVKDIAPDIKPPFNTVNYDEWEYKLSEDTEQEVAFT